MQEILQRNNVTITGQGVQPMLFAHGFGCDQTVWKRILPAFENDYKIVLFDFIEAGKADHTGFDVLKYNTLDGYADDILDICHSLNLVNVIFIGHSVSCMIGALAAIKAPGIFEKLVFICPSPKYINEKNYTGGFEREDVDGVLEFMENNYTAWAKHIAPAIMGNPDKPFFGESLVTSFCETEPERAKIFARIFFYADNRKELPNIPVKSLTLQCLNDILAPHEVGEYINKYTPANTLKVLNASGHCPHVSAAGETFLAIKQYLTMQ